MADETSKHEIKLRRTGGQGANTQWAWEIHADGKVIKRGTSVGEEHKAFTAARKFSEKLAKG